MKVHIGALVEGDEFLYVETHGWDFLSSEKAEDIAVFLGEMADRAEKLAAQGKPGDLTATLTQEGIEGVEDTLVIPGLTRKDVRKFQNQFTQEYERMLDKWAK
jgi:hypothetical protein